MPNFTLIMLHLICKIQYEEESNLSWIIKTIFLLPLVNWSVERFEVFTAMNIRVVILVVAPCSDDYDFS
jgi:hypothetical protein